MQAQVGDTLAYQHPLGGLHTAEVLEIQPNRIICRVALGWIQIKHFDPRTGISTRGVDDGLIIFQIPKIQEGEFPCLQ